MLPALCSKPTSVTFSTRSPMLTLARMGFSEVSKASSVMLMSVIRTGRTRLRLQINRASGVSIAAISSVPDFARLLLAIN